MSRPMKRIARMVVMVAAFVSLLSASPLLAQRVTEPDERPAPVDNDPWYCSLLFCSGPSTHWWCPESCAGSEGGVSSEICAVKTEKYEGSLDAKRDFCLACCAGIKPTSPDCNACTGHCLSYY